MQHKKMIEELNNKIMQLNSENQRLQSNIQSIQKTIEHINKTSPDASTKYCLKEDNKKKLILYGLEEDRGEVAKDVYERIIYAFQDILNINIRGYVEDLKRLGRNGYKRPLLIEFLSKNLTREILHNKHLFKNSGLSVSEVLEEEALKQRKKLVEIMIGARRQGKRANIVNNRLYIDGKEYLPKSPDYINVPNVEETESSGPTGHDNSFRG
ncbi:hypothetical protein NE865_14641 [Phthorimaea operculella]|nr:hypothetical protein NE865_14641 [Phthorimaea operculella]